MNLNEYPDELQIEEQATLNDLISRMDKVVENLDQRMKTYVEEANNSDISINPDLYLAHLLAQQGIQDTKENRKRLLQARDELYNTRLLLHYEDDEGVGTEEIKVGLHSCIHGPDQYVVSWKQPLCRHYLLDNASTEFENVVQKKDGGKHHTYFTLLVKSQVKLRFTHVVQAMNMFPAVFNDQSLKEIRGKGFFSDAFLDKMIKGFDPDKYNPEEAADIISDEFLQELLERRSTPEFKNIVFSIQKKQGEIIQAPYNRNMIVQGCAGSGKSMIMLHRLPILLYDNPDSLSRTNLYVITPSQMYIQLAENMRHQLEISDISMGTIEQYYNHCISKYPGYKGNEYGRISYAKKLSKEHEQYVYSDKCVKDIIAYYDELLQGVGISLEKAHSELNLTATIKKKGATYFQRNQNRLTILQPVINANNDILMKYHTRIRNALESFRALKNALYYRKDTVLRAMAKDISKYEEEINQAKKEMLKLDSETNSIAIKNRQNSIGVATTRIEELDDKRRAVYADTEYFDRLDDVNSKIDTVLTPFDVFKEEYIQNSPKEVYDAIGEIGRLIGGFFMVSWEMSRLENKYFEYAGSLDEAIKMVQDAISILQMTNDKYLDFEYYSKICAERDLLADANSSAIKNAYVSIMEKIGVEQTENGPLKALRCSPYIYLQTIYLFQGAPSAKKESLVAIDEVQGIAPEEIRLLKNINGKDVVFNMYGDIYQHIEGTKGVDSWDEYSEILDYDLHEMKENYRNASQITEYCNRIFDMDMIAINTPGKGVHELNSQSEFQAEMITQLMDDQRVGLGAILVGDDAEARYLVDYFSAYEYKLHDTTQEDFSIHNTRWNIINIDEAKGLEFSSVIVLSGRMSRNQRYIACTRALDDLYVYSGLIDIAGYEESEQEKPKPQKTKVKERQISHNKNNKIKDHSNSAVRAFFEKNKLEVIDMRDNGGRLWVIGEKTTIRDIVNQAIKEFGISGKYASSKDIRNKKGWCTKTDK